MSLKINNTGKPTASSPKRPKKAPAGGAATGGGMNFQAAVTSIAAVHLLRNTPIGWLAGIADDTPLAIWAETNGPGDDVRVEIKDDLPIEVQAKKGLSRGASLWDSLIGLAEGLRDKKISYGILAIAPDASGTIRSDLANEMARLAGGRRDDLSEITREFVRRLEAKALPVAETCQRLRIQVIHALEADRANLDVAQDALRQLCVHNDDAASAWDALTAGAMAIIERKGRWDVTHLLRLLESRGIDLRPGRSAAAVLQALNRWRVDTTQTFSLPGLPKQLPLSALLPMSTVLEGPSAKTAGPAEALERYHARATTILRGRAEAFDAEFTGLFHRNAVVIAGPGLGKSTLTTHLAHSYADQGFPVLRVVLKSVAASMRTGSTFEECLYRWGLDSAPIGVDSLRAANFSNLVILADGLDDCGDQHHNVADGLAALASSHPEARVIVTTRPIGYESLALAAWRHYSLKAPDTDKGKSNLAALIRAATDSEDLKSSALEVATRELDKSKATVTAPIISSPQLLGMAASLICKEGALPPSRSTLYERMIALIAASPRAKGTLVPSEAVRQRVLDILGWLLVKDPICTTYDLVRTCSAVLASELGVTPLAATNEVEPAIAFWESGGLLERLYHSGASFMTFIHKSFAEFAAARYLVTLEGSDRTAALQLVVDSPKLNEILGFAVGMGAGDEVARLLIEGQGDGGQPDQILRAIALLTDPDAQISDSYAATLVATAFNEAIRGEDESYEVGIGLVALARQRPDLAGPPTEALLDHDSATARLIGWAVAAVAAPEWADYARIRTALAELGPYVGPGLGGALLGGWKFHARKDRDLLQEIALAVLRDIPIDEVDVFLRTDLSGDSFQNVGFLEKVEHTLDRRSLGKVKRPWLENMVPMAWATSDFADNFNAAARATLLGVVTALEPAIFGGASPTKYPHVAALLSLGGFYDVVAGDVYAWMDKYDIEAVKETLRLLVVASGIDRSILSSEADAIVKRFADEPSLGLFSIGLPSVDLPQLAWAKVPTSSPNRELVQRALRHGSEWLVQTAANVLEAAPPDLADLRRLIDQSEDLELAALAHLVVTRYRSSAVEILLPVLAGPGRKGLEYVLQNLAKLKTEIEPDARLVAILNVVLFGKSANVAKAAADLLLGLVEQSRFCDATLLNQAFAHWQEHETPYPTSGGTVPSTPRPNLLKALVALDAINEERLVGLLQDTRPDVRSLAQERIVSTMESSAALRALVVNAIVRHSVDPSIAAALLLKCTFDQDQLKAMIPLLTDPDAHWRRAAMEMLRSPPMSRQELEARARSLQSDPEVEIREYARRLLKGMVRGDD